MNQQMQMLLYYAQLGMCTAMNGTSMGPPLPLPAGAPPVANMPMFPMLTPGQVAAAAQWQAGMGPAQLANIAAAAAVAATAVTSNEVCAARTAARVALHAVAHMRVACSSAALAAPADTAAAFLSRRASLACPGARRAGRAAARWTSRSGGCAWTRAAAAARAAWTT